MKVKSANEYRKFYKEQRGFKGVESQNEHFVGSKYRLNGSDNKIWGFFNLVNGDKDDIPNFIKHYLDLAPDEQAVYEFLQNAYDANATRFAFLCDEEYLLVFNNGDKIDISGVRSILNVGQSTKDGKSDIGKFGIGFKLAHCLLGESNGQKEIMENGGPILFSWNRYEDLKQFSEITAITDLSPTAEEFDQNYQTGKYCETKPYPWLFRILVTSFPAGINESFLDLEYVSHDNMPNPEELLILKERISQFIVSSGHYERGELETGTIIFVRLGKNKSSKLIPENVKDALGFSLNTLNLTQKNCVGLQEIRLGMRDEDSICASNELDSLVFSLPKESAEYEKILSDAQPADRPDSVQMVFLYPRNCEFFLTRHANIYLYFPLTEENLKLNFILHCNCFHNQSSRTGINSQSTRNINIFKTFVVKLKSRLDDLRQNDFERYTSLYAALLLSERTNTDIKQWAVKQLYDPILNYLSEHVPAKNRKCYPKSEIRIPDIQLDVSPETFGVQDYHWFYYDHSDVVKACKDLEKIGIKAVRLHQLISDSNNIEKVNVWLNSQGHYLELFLDEIEKNKSSLPTSNQRFVANFRKLQIFRDDKKRLLSLNALENDSQSIILSDEYAFIASILKMSAFHVFELPEKYKRLKAFAAELAFPHLLKTNKFLKYFRTKVNNLNQSFSLNQILILLYFFTDENIPFFSELILKEENDAYFIIARTNERQQYYIDQEKVALKAYLDQYHSEKLIHLPVAFTEKYCKNEHILSREDLYEKILDIEEDSRELIHLVVESGYENIQKKYLKRIELFFLEVGRRYAENSYESKVLNLAIRFGDDDLKNKIILKQPDGGNSVKISTVIFDDRVVFKNNKKNKNVENDYIL
ncbi:MAG: ATP-binding protein, partial [Desulfamplus sp.]|nr:ATP-binding protein [Desulfamplus sp.]